MTRDELLEKILKTYQQCYDIERFDNADDPLAATADFHEHQSGYMLIRKAEMWSADRHEYSFFYNIPHLSSDTFDNCMQRTRELGELKVHPEPGHMSSNLVAVFLCDDADDDALAALKKYRYRKSFSFSLKGWMEVHTAAAVLGTDTVASNKDGKSAARFLTVMMHPEKKKKKRKNLLAAMLD